LRIAIFGGTFDPIHNAHLIAAREAAAQFSLDRVLFVPAARPPHKQYSVEDFQHRFKMVEIACAGDPVLTASALEAGSEISYSIRTIQNVRATLDPQDWLCFVIGADAFAEITTWYQWQNVVQLVDFIVIGRPGFEYTVPPGARVHRLDSLALCTSSSAIRRELARGGEPAEVPPSVLAYIREHGLYRSQS
jgi:nicotinate (nicotinamide) nucleotide adenylyltransferase